MWTLCMVFFQLVLLLGYAYAHALASRARPRLQAIVHIALLAASLAFLPIVPSAAWKPQGGDNPVAGILGLLFATVGLPYFLLSATSPLVQAWFARARPGDSPWPLFALSNLASMLALLGYPFLIEPWLGLHGQSRAWSAGYALFAIACATLAWRSRDLPRPAFARAAASPSAARPSAGAIGLWLVLATLGAAMLLAVTNHLTQNIPSIPLLWLVPLAIYLLTFILCFEGRRWYRRDAYLGLLAVALGAMAIFLVDKRLQFELYWQIGVFSAGLFVVCMFCHGELAARRPVPAHLTLFYLVVAAGGVLGGALVGIVAPVVLPGFLELEITLALVAFVALGTNFGRPVGLVAALGGLAAVACGTLAWRVATFMEDTVHVERNYYGVLRVKESEARAGDPDSRYRSLVNGAILHGEQWLAPQYRRGATSYYKVTSGIGRTLLAYRGKPIRVGVIGLGAGTLAAYGTAGDVYRFYDINPAVVRIARTWFTFLGDSAAKIEIVLGDARLSLERERPEGFDVLAIDAFTGDSIPVHLITSEAVGEFLRHMKPDGVIAYHVSNRYLDLKPVLLAIAEKHGLEYAYLREPDSDGGTTSDWVLLTRNKRFLLRPAIVAITEPVAPEPGWRLWTDDYNDLWQVLRR